MGLEGLVAQHLRAWIAYRGGTETLHYWRTRSVQRRDLAGLKAFREDYPESETALLHLGPEPLRVDGIDCLPLECVLRGMTPSAPLL